MKFKGLPWGLGANAAGIWLADARIVGRIDRGQQETETAMSVEEKTQHCLQLLLLFDLEIRVIE